MEFKPGQEVIIMINSHFKQLYSFIVGWGCQHDNWVLQSREVISEVLWTIRGKVLSFGGEMGREIWHCLPGTSEWEEGKMKGKEWGWEGG